MKNIMHKLYQTLMISAGTMLPFIAAAQSSNPGQALQIVDSLQQVFNSIVVLLFIVATVVFMWGLIKFISSAGDDAERTKGKQLMTWGVVGMAVMVAAWGVAQLIITFFGVGGTTIPINPGQLR